MIDPLSVVRQTSGSLDYTVGLQVMLRDLLRQLLAQPPEQIDQAQGQEESHFHAYHRLYNVWRILPSTSACDGKEGLYVFDECRNIEGTFPEAGVIEIHQTEDFLVFVGGY